MTSPTSESNGASTRGLARRALLFGMSKPVLAVVTATILATSGSAAWFFTEWLTIPGLKDQIHALEGEVNRLEGLVDRLSTEVDNLSFENDRYSKLNGQLNRTTVEYQQLNSQLNASTIQLSSLNAQLNDSNAVFADLNSQLSTQNEVYAAMNSELNETKQELAALNQDLMTVVSFLNDTSTDIQRNLESWVDFLAEQIDVNRLLVLEILKNTYQQRIQNWDCGYRDYFLTETFVRDGDIPIQTSSLLPLVLGYVEDHVLLRLCLDLVNLEAYLQTTVSDFDGITSNELIQGVSRFSSLAMSYYFPNAAPVMGNEEAISSEEWAEASYQCSNLERPFRWYNS